MVLFGDLGSNYGQKNDKMLNNHLSLGNRRQMMYDWNM
jgi:hypothetical protein